MATPLFKLMARVLPAGPGRQGPVRQAEAQADTAGAATLATVIADHNALLAKLRAAGIIATV